MTPREVIGMLAVTAATAGLVGCNTQQALSHPKIAATWNPSRGRALIGYYGCGSCHVIGGVEGANGRVGPPLTRYTRRYHQIAGVLPNTPANLVRWIMNPPKYVPGVDMPVLGIGVRGARDIAAYLYGQ